MKKPALFISLIIVFFLFASPVKSQEFTFEKAYQDYTFTREVYYQSLSEYQKAKEFYLKNKTLSLKEEARKATLNFLRSRDELYRVYLTALRIKLIETRGLTKEEKDKILGNVDSEIAWYKSHKEAYKDSDILEDQFAKSKEAETRYKEDTSQIVHESLYMVSLGESISTRNDHEETYSLIRKELDGKVAEGKLRIDPFNRWLTDIDGVIANLKDNEAKSKIEINKIYAQNYTDPFKIFGEAVDILDDSIVFLNQLNNFLHELLTSYNMQLQLQQK